MFLSPSLQLRAVIGQESIWYNLKALDKQDRILSVPDSLTHHFKIMELKITLYQRYSSSLQQEARSQEEDFLLPQERTGSSSGYHS